MKFLPLQNQNVMSKNHREKVKMNKALYKFSNLKKIILINILKQQEWLEQIAWKKKSDFSLI